MNLNTKNELLIWALIILSAWCLWNLLPEEPNPIEPGVSLNTESSVNSNDYILLWCAKTDSEILTCTGVKQ